MGGGAFIQVYSITEVSSALRGRTGSGTTSIRGTIRHLAPVVYVKAVRRPKCNGGRVPGVACHMGRLSVRKEGQVADLLRSLTIASISGSGVVSARRE